MVSLGLLLALTHHRVVVQLVRRPLPNSVPARRKRAQWLLGPMPQFCAMNNSVSSKRERTSNDYSTKECP